jgi:hypothetical protein
MTSINDAEQKIADFLNLMVQVTYIEQKEGVTDDNDDCCKNCKSAICAMVQRNNDLNCWRTYAKEPEKLIEDLSNSKVHGGNSEDC